MSIQAAADDTPGPQAHPNAALLDPVALIIITWIGTALTILILAACTKLAVGIRNKPRWNEIFVGVAFLALVAYATLMTVQADNMYSIVNGMASQAITGVLLHDHGAQYSAFQFAMTGIMWTVVCAAKLGVLSRYWRLPPNEDSNLERNKRILISLVGITVFVYISFWVLTGFIMGAGIGSIEFGITSTLPSYAQKLIIVDADQFFKRTFGRGHLLVVIISNAADIFTTLLVLAYPVPLLYYRCRGWKAISALAFVLLLVSGTLATDCTRIIHTIKQSAPNGILLALCDIIHCHVVVVLGLLMVLVDLRNRMKRRVRSESQVELVPLTSLAVPALW